MNDLKELEKKCQIAFQNALRTKTVLACMEWNRLEDEYDIQLKLKNAHIGSKLIDSGTASDNLLSN